MIADVLVVGGGVIGLSVAWRAAREGASVHLLDPGGQRAASWAAAGMLAPVSEASFGEEDGLRLGLAALARYPSFVSELEAEAGQEVGLRPEGTLIVAFDADDRTALARLSAFRTRLGLPTLSLTGAQARGHEPFLSGRVSAGVLAGADLSVDNRRLLAALRAALARRGALTTVGTASALLSRDGRVTGVRTDDGEVLPASSVVLAAGCWSGRLAGAPELPVRPVKGQILRLRVPGGMAALTGKGGLLGRTVRGMVRGREVYLVPRDDGEIVVGATVEERGFDTDVTAGAVQDLLTDAAELVPTLGELHFVEAIARLRPGTPDNGPIVGRTGPAGLVVATGHYRNGVLLAPATADAVTALLTGGDPSPEWKPFHPGRFPPQGGPAREAGS